MPYILLGPGQEPGDPPIFRGPLDVLPIRGLQTPPDYATVNIYPRNGTDRTNYYSDICPNCGLVHHLYSIQPYLCYAGTVWGKPFLTNVVLSDIPSGDLMGIVWGKSNYVAVGANCCVTAPDAQTWTLRKIPNGNWQRVAFGGGKHVAVGYTDAYDGIIAYSSDGGLTWTVAQTLTGNSWSPLADVIWDGAQFVTSGYNCVYTSSDGITWTERSVPAGIWKALAYNGTNLYIAVDGQKAQAMTSADAVTWALATVGAANLPVALNALTYGRSVFAGVGASVCYTTVDGVTWTSRTIGAGTYYGITATTANLITVGTGVGAYSTDGTTWNAMTMPSATAKYQGISADPAASITAAIGLSAVGAYSTNLTAWTASTPKCGYEYVRAGKVVES
jgi:hypothetical protein